MTTQKISKGKLLVAEPVIINDQDFNRAVILLAEHNEQGYVGFILNKKYEKHLDEIFPDAPVNIPIFNGGPVEKDILYFIHRVPHLIPGSVEISSGIYWGGNFEVVLVLLQEERITQHDIRFFVGYAGWDTLQLDQELNSHAWIVKENNYQQDIIDKAPSNFWREIMLELGGNYLLWSNSPENPVFN